ncbi:MAG: Amine oxidase, flavin-containing [Phenylobacterium sp.]|nr:Amine oxidase, flavin-containing [Phenylobacterium sp.]
MMLSSGTARPGVRRIAVIGGGAAGLFSARLLDSAYEVTLFEAAPRIGGHAYTVEVPEGPDAGTRLDIGFVNCAYSAYPRLIGYFDHFGIDLALSDSSFCVISEQSREQYVFAMGPQGRVEGGEAPDPSRFRYLNRLARFYALAAIDLEAGRLKGLTVGEYCRQAGLSQDLIENFIVPVYASLWVTPPADTLNLSAETIYTYYRRAGLPQFKDYDGYYVVNASQAYIEALMRGYRGQLKLSCGVKRLFRHDDGVELLLEDGTRQHYDAAVVALHADDALKILDDPSEAERELLGAWSYPACRVVVHSDPSVLEPDQRFAAAYSYLARPDFAAQDRLTVTYNLNRIMQLDASGAYFMTLNPTRAIDPARTLLDMTWRHPFFNVPAVATQSRLPELQDQRRTFFCGSYFSCGSHEDAVCSAEAVSRLLGVEPLVKSWERAA